MEILLSNDDGYKAKGIKVLAEMVSSWGHITVVAPKHHQSGTGMGVSLGHKMLAHKALPGYGPGDWSYLDATPASCVKFAMNYCFVEGGRPDVALLGINHGSNASSGANYSGTLGAAEEAAIYGVRSIGVSLDSMDHDADFATVEAFFPAVFRFLMDNWPENSYGLFYNVNFPSCAVEDVKGLKVARQGKGYWVEEFEKWDDYQGEDLEEGESPYYMAGRFVSIDEDESTADHRLLSSHWITITPSVVDKTYYSEYQRLADILIKGNFKLR